MDYPLFQTWPAHSVRSILWRIAMATLLLSLLFPLGCASHTARTNALLEREYQTMTAQNLTLYYYQLQDQIEIVDNSASTPRVSLGFGFGSYGHHSGTGVGLSSDLPQPAPSQQLRERRNQVRLEMQRRGLSLPQ